MGCSSNRLRQDRRVKEEYAILKGLNFYSQGEFLEAKKNYEDVLKFNQNNILVLREIALLEYDLGDKEKSIYYYRKVLKLDNRDQIALRNLGVILYLDGRFAEGEKYLRSLNIKNHDMQTLKILGKIYCDKNEMELSQKYLEEASKYLLNCDLEYFQLYSKVMIIKKEKEALYYFLKKSYNKYLTNKEFNLFYAKILGETFEEWTESQNILKKYLIKNGGDGDIYLYLAYTYYKLNNYAQGQLLLKLVPTDYKYNPLYMELNRKFAEG